MTPERSRSVIPPAAWVVAALLAVLGYLAMSMAFGFWSNESLPFPFFILMGIGPLIVGAYAVAIGYVYGDAKRRGMRHVMWTLLAIFVPNGIGIVLYFIMREPMPVFCSRCGGRMAPGFAFCPTCGVNILPSCGACHRTMQPGWTHCAWCGATSPSQT